MAKGCLITSRFRTWLQFTFSEKSLFFSATEETLVPCSPAQLLQTRRGDGWRNLKSVLVTTKGARSNAARPLLGWSWIKLY